MRYCHESDHGNKTAQRVVREYLACIQSDRASASTQICIRSAVKSYFGVNDVLLDLPRARKRRLDPVSDDDSHMTLEDFYTMLRSGNQNIVMRTIMLIKLQSGMDSSTFTDRFNHEGYPQIVKYFRTDNYKAWSLEMCPVPIRLVRVKTNVQYTTFLDRDVIAQLQKYLTWKETKRGKQDSLKAVIHYKAEHANTTHMAVGQLFRDRRTCRSPGKGFTQAVQDTCAQGQASSQKHADCKRLQAVRRRPCAETRTDGLV